MYVIEANAVIIATGGAAGLYKPNPIPGIFPGTKCGIRRLTQEQATPWASVPAQR